MDGPLAGIARLRDARSKRASSYDRSGGNDDFVQVPAGQTVALAAIDGPGCVRHIWITLSAKDEMIRRHAVLRMFWDGQTHPSIESPLGDFFGQGWGENYCFQSLPLAAAPREGRALNCYFPMPFADGARIEIENQSDHPIDRLYFYVDYELYDRPQADVGRFHAWWNRELTDPHQGVEQEWGLFGPDHKNPGDADNYLFCDVKGRGHFVGVNYFVDCPTPLWPGEGDDMFLVDGEAWPGSLHGTGTEDYFNSAWSPVEHYTHPYFGYARVNNRSQEYLKNPAWLGRTHCYRFHLEDPIHFRKSLRASIEHGHANGLVLDISSVAYWYQTLPSKPFPPLPPIQERANMPPIGPVEIHRWRQAWREARGGGKLWGHET